VGPEQRCAGLLSFQRPLGPARRRLAALARLISVLAWVVAALNIVHLLGPTLDLLDSVAVVVGGLVVSILTVVKGVLSLAMLLWAATIASNLFERRITRVSEITPRARVLLGKLLKATLVTLAVVLSLTSIGIDLTTFALFPESLGSVLGWDYSGASRTCSAGSFCCWTSRSSRAT
jgi:small-conductance mechanosensitive channel